MKARGSPKQELVRELEDLRARCATLEQEARAARDAVEREVARRLEAERTSLQAQQEFKIFVDSASDLILIHDRDLRIRYVNPAVESVASRPRQDYLGKRIGEIIQDPEPAECFESSLRQVLRSGHGSSISFRMKSRRSERHMQARLAPVQNVAGEVGSVLAVVRDITRFKRLEERLRQAKREAEEASRAKSEFLASMSHEIRTPLNAVLGLAERLSVLKDPADKGEYARMIKHSADALLALIDDILDLSKIEAGKLDVHEQDFELAGLLEKIVSPYGYQAREKGLKLNVRIGSGVPAWLRTDADKLGQVLTNLVSNAIKFTEKGEVAVSAMLGSRGEERLTLLFCVRDSGMGIPEEMQPCLFKSFSQLDSSLSKGFGGAGLGLAISKRLVEMLGGEIWVESMPGRGSAFTFSLPVVGIRKPAPRVLHAERPAHGLKDIPALSFLLAEDNRINQFFLKDYFEAMGHAVDIAENGRIVLDMLKAKPYDLILMDIQMPHMDGLEATRTIRAATGEPWSGIPIVALTAYALSQDRSKALAAGMDAYVPKPINFEELEREIINALAARGGNARGGEAKPREAEAKPRRSVVSRPSEVIRRMFLSEVPQRQEALGAHLEAEDLEGLSGEAHGLRNGAHFAGAMDVYELATELENAARQGRREEALATARRLLDALSEYLRANERDMQIG